MKGLMQSDPFTKQPVTRISKKNEKRIAKRMKAKRQPASGALYYAKGDIEGAFELIEHKMVIKGLNITLKGEALVKIWNEATQRSKTAIVVVTIPKLPIPDKDWALIPLSDLKRMETKRG